MPKGDRTRADDLLATSLASGSTIAEACATAGVSESTAYRRLRDAGFQVRVREIRRAMVGTASARLAANMRRAADVLVGLLDSADEGERRHAATKLLELAYRTVELEELRERLEELESHLQRQHT